MTLYYLAAEAYAFTLTEALRPALTDGLAGAVYMISGIGFMDVLFLPIVSAG